MSIFKMKLRFSIVLLLISGIVCAQKKQIIFPPPVLGMDSPEFIDFCKVPCHKKELVYTRFYYNGIKGCWSIYSNTKECANLKAELEIPESVEMRKEFIKYFKNVHEHYWDRYLIIDAIGTYDDSIKSGYGNLGSKPANFIVKYLIDVQQVINKKKKATKPSSH